MEKRKHSRRIRHAASVPFIWIPLLAFFFVDIFLEIYHQVCFPLYGLPKVQRKKYIRIDRQKLKYLSTYEKLGCMYCGYTNGWLRYAAVIAGETERYWCGIKHKKSDDVSEPKHHSEFAEYDNEEEFKDKYVPR